ncbi:MAG: four helix bundle protein [Parcubacteria group bacterium]|jgi:hypothetical protein
MTNFVPTKAPPQGVSGINVVHKNSKPKLFIDLEKLYGDCYDRVKNFPKLDKNLLGKEILQFLNDTHKASLISIYAPSYLPLASANFDLFKKSLRIAVDKKFISCGWYSAHFEIIVSIGRDIGKWLKTKRPKC